MFRSASADKLRSKNFFARLVGPLTSSTFERFNPSVSASTSTMASLARPLSGGAVTATFSASGLLTDDGVAAGPGLRAHGDDAAFGMIADFDHAIPSKSTVPSRMNVAPSSMAISKSLLIPIERCSSLS